MSDLKAVCSRTQLFANNFNLEYNCRNGESTSVTGRLWPFVEFGVGITAFRGASSRINVIESTPNPPKHVNFHVLMIHEVKYSWRLEFFVCLLVLGGGRCYLATS